MEPGCGCTLLPGVETPVTEPQAELPSDQHPAAAMGGGRARVARRALRFETKGEPVPLLSWIVALSSRAEVPRKSLRLFAPTPRPAGIIVYRPHAPRRCSIILALE